MKRILCLIAMVVLCITLTACSSTVSTNNSSEIKNTSSYSESSYDSSSYYEEISYGSSSYYEESSYDNSSYYEESSYQSESSLGYRTTTGKKKTCIACNGTGIIRQYATNDPYDPGYLMECVACHGKGYYYE